MENVIDKGRSTFSDLIFTKKVCDSGAVLEVTQQKVHYVPDSGYISLARIPFVPGDVDSGVAKVGNGWARAQPIMSSAQPIFMSIVQPIYAPFHVKIYNK